MIRTIKIQNENSYPDGEWITIANESDKCNDDDIYFYIFDEVDLSKLKVGDTIQLDEYFTVIEVEK